MNHANGDSLMPISYARDWEKPPSPGPLSPLRMPSKTGSEDVNPRRLPRDGSERHASRRMHGALKSGSPHLLGNDTNFATLQAYQVIKPSVPWLERRPDGRLFCCRFYCPPPLSPCGLTVRAGVRCRFAAETANRAGTGEKAAPDCASDAGCGGRCTGLRAAFRIRSGRRGGAVRRGCVRPAGRDRRRSSPAAFPGSRAARRPSRCR